MAPSGFPRGTRLALDGIGRDAEVRRTILIVLLLLGIALPAATRADGEVDREAVAKRFFDAYTTGDMATLDSLYDANVKWSDPILSFGDRAGTMGMWRWEAEQSPKFSYEMVPRAPGLPADQVQVRWHADYHLNGNPIHNDVLATLTINDEGKVVAHKDDYSWEKWAAQAFPGLAHSPAWPYIEGVVRFGVGGLIRFNSWETNRKIAKTPGAANKLGAAFGE
jgi:hypothetical protein